MIKVAKQFICIYMHLRLFHPHILDCCPGRRRPLHEVEVAAAVDQVHLNERAGVEHHKLARPIGVSPFLTYIFARSNLP